MKTTTKLLSMLLLCCSMLFWSQNVKAQCIGLGIVTATQVSDGSWIGDAVATANHSGTSANKLYNWYKSPSYVGSGKSIGSLTAGNYKVFIYDSINSCSDTALVTITDTGVYNCAGAGFGISETDSCGPGMIWLHSYMIGNIGSMTYSWSTGSTNTKIGPVGAGTYTVIGTNTVTGCKDTIVYTAIDDTCQPCQNFRADILEIDSCQKNDVKLLAYPFDSSTRYTYLWNTGATTRILTGRTTGSFWVRVVDNVTGCVDTAFITVVDDTCNPCASFQAYIFETDPCAKNDVKLRAYPSDTMTGNRYSCIWNTGSTANVLTGKTSGSYWVRIYDSITGCIDTAYRSVADDTCNPCAQFYTYMSYQDRCLPNDVNVQSYAYGGSGNYSYLWNNGTTASNQVNKSTGWYKVTVTDNVTGCIRKDSVYIQDTVYKCCKAFIYVNDPFIGATKSIFGDVLDSTASTTYTWNFGDGTTGAGQSQTKTYTTPGSKTICLYTADATGCKDTACKTVLAPPPGKNLRITHYGSPYILALNKKHTYLYYQNIGTTTETATIEYKYPAGTTLNNANYTVASNTNNKLVFNVGSLAPGAAGYIHVTLNVPSSFTIGAIKCDTAYALTMTNDIDVSDNISTDCDSVVSSYDPNDKLAYPKGTGEDGVIDPNTKELAYLINFQNEGNYRTYFVRVEDEIDPSLDINTLMIGDVSHPFRLVKNGSKLIWYFDDIELTPKAQNEPRSKGYVQYSLKLKSGLPLGTQIRNTAYIYFDQNPAIITNTTKNTLKSASSVASARMSNDDFTAALDHEKVIILGQKRIDAARIYNLQGQLLGEVKGEGKRAEIQANHLSNQVLIIHVDMGESTVIKKFKF